MYVYVCMYKYVFHHRCFMDEHNVCCVTDVTVPVNSDQDIRKRVEIFRFPLLFSKIIGTFPFITFIYLKELFFSH